MSTTILNPETAVFVSPELLSQYEEQGYTILHCETRQREIPFLSTSPLTLSWVTVTKSTAIIHRQTKKKLQLLHAINIPVDPEKYWFKYYGEILLFTLIYPKIPSDWDYFDFLGDPKAVTEIPVGHMVTGWLVKNIKRNDTGIYRLKLD